MADQAGVTLSHFGICVSDPERSKRFYADALGFELSHELHFAEPFDILTELPGLKGHAAFYQKGPVTIELLWNDEPETVGPASRRPMNQLGLTHIAFVVENLEATAERIEDCGGQPLRQTLVSSPVGDMMFATDPDGTRLELWEKKV